MEKKIKEIREKIRENKEIYELKISESNKAKEMYYKYIGQLELAYELSDAKKVDDKKVGKK